MDATVQFQAIQEEYRGLPVLFKHLPYLTEPQVGYIPVPVQDYRTEFWNVVKNVAEAIPSEGYTEGIKMVAGLFTSYEDSRNQSQQGPL